MSPKNIWFDCDRAADLLITRSPELSATQDDFLQAHLAVCAACSEQSHAVENAIHEMRSTSMYADPAMVRATQMRVRVRAAELRQQQETMRPLWISSALALGWAVLSMPLLWQGFAWLGHTSHIPDLVWQTGFVLMALTPIAAVGTVGLASRMHNRVTS